MWFQRFTEADSETLEKLESEYISADRLGNSNYFPGASSSLQVED